MILRDLPLSEDPRLLTGWEHGEDAALWDLDEKRAGIFTLDFITPVVDDPFLWGQIAAANALSDVFAMGGRVLLGLNIVCFPAKTLSFDVLGKILEGGSLKVKEAQGVLAGGHSVEDDEPKYGLAVFGEVDKDRIWSVQGSRIGDELVLTKPLGTGIIATAIKAGMASKEEERAATDSMTLLNNISPGLTEGLALSIHAATDVTGFGMAGHLLDMLSPGSNAVLTASKLPVLPGAFEHAAMGLLPAGAYRNKESYERNVLKENSSSSFILQKEDLLYDPQTSGGLLLSLPRGTGATMVEKLQQHGFPWSALVGTIEKGEGKILLQK